jgi:excisionase family DNA binding protein
MTVPELAAYLKVHRVTVYRLASRRGLPGFRIGTELRFRRADIDEWIKKQEKTAE